jgi:chromate transporter
VNLLFLFARFVLIGLFAIGGGLATLPFLFELAARADWLTPELIGDMLAVAQSLPGAMGVNLAAYTGFQYAGLRGAVAAAAGLICPSIIIIIFAARMLNAFKAHPVVQAVFSGLRPAAAGLLLAAGFEAVKLSLYNRSFSAWHEAVRWPRVLVFAGLFFCIRRFKLHPFIPIAAAGALGMILGL